MEWRINDRIIVNKLGLRLVMGKLHVVLSLRSGGDSLTRGLKRGAPKSKQRTLRNTFIHTCNGDRPVISSGFIHFARDPM